jgi:uncharacterized protein YbaR (Trm112 family)
VLLLECRVMAEINQAWRLLVCPKTQAALVFCGDGLVSSDAQCRLKYPVAGEIPRLIVDEAEELTVEAWQAVMAKYRK